MFTGVVDDGFLVEVGARQPDQVGLADLTQSLVGYPDHGGFGYDAIRVCLQQQNTEDLYSRWLFGLGEAPVSGSGEQSDAAAAPAQTSDEEKNTPQEPETTSEGSEAPEENG